MAKKLSGYHALISKATGVTEPREIRMIESVMRTQRSTLDGLDLSAFNALSRDAVEALKDEELRGMMEAEFPRA